MPGLFAISDLSPSPFRPSDPADRPRPQLTIDLNLSRRRSMTGTPLSLRGIIPPPPYPPPPPKSYRPPFGYAWAACDEPATDEAELLMGRMGVDMVFGRSRMDSVDGEVSDGDDQVACR